MQPFLLITKQTLCKTVSLCFYVKLLQQMSALPPHPSQVPYSNEEFIIAAATLFLTCFLSAFQLQFCRSSTFLSFFFCPDPILKIEMYCALWTSCSCNRGGRTNKSTQYILQLLHTTSIFSFYSHQQNKTHNLCQHLAMEVKESTDSYHSYTVQVALLIVEMDEETSADHRKK